MTSKASALPDIDVEEFRKVVRSRRSIRRFKPDPIPRDVLSECLELATLAPNSSNLQPWEFFVVESADLRPSWQRPAWGRTQPKPHLR